MKSRENFHKRENIYILAKFHEKMLFSEIRAHLVILLLYRAQTRKSELSDGIEVEILYTLRKCK